MNKKGQMEVQETILVVVVFLIILIFGLVLFSKFTEQGILNEYLKNEKIRFEAMITTFPLMPELRCSFLSQEASCIDSYKLLGFKIMSKGAYKDYYRPILGNLNITVYNVYPERNSEVCELATINDCGVWDLYENKPKKYKAKYVVRSPVSLYYPDKDAYGIGELVIEWYA